MLMRTTSDDLHDDQQRFENDQQHQFHVSFSIIIATCIGQEGSRPLAKSQDFSFVIFRKGALALTCSLVIPRNDADN
ncbi:hypothetical protein K443DRAFT_199626 [Laccaria amethystina LaAM-08-1]|jgi:hypothetical protein|uniref:Uncharacterized protein n=1 Tax=Laccaria amethystina LaAM-08-1 TaxID=1095629 RepID=A0A0C9YAD0_9AGAR|nr:hypothetical protein K443DRAFT_199626 [Laccaria amethystina LaAM-08-1]